MEYFKIILLLINITLIHRSLSNNLREIISGSYEMTSTDIGVKHDPVLPPGTPTVTLFRKTQIRINSSAKLLFRITKYLYLLHKRLKT